jgi:hypothetical protein
MADWPRPQNGHDVDAAGVNYKSETERKLPRASRAAMRAGSYKHLARYLDRA